MQQMIFIADRIACSTCFGHHYAHHQELERVLYRWLLPVVFGAVKMENIVFRLGRFCVFGIKCRALYMFVIGHVGCRGGCVWVS